MYIIRPTALLIFGIVLLSGLAVSAQQTVEVRLETRKPLLRAIAGGEKHSYDVQTKVGHYVQVLLDGRSAPVGVTASLPGGKTLDMGEPAKGPQLIMFVAASTGTCRIHVTSQQSGRYSIVLNAARPATPDNTGQINAYNELMIAHRLAAAGRMPEAATAFQRALDAITVTGDPFLQASALFGLGRVSRLAGNNETASEYFARSAKLFQTGGSWDEIFRDLSSLYLVLGGKSQAYDYLSNALPLVRALKNERLEAILLLAVARIAADLGKQADSLDSTERALELLRLTAKRGAEVFSLTEISDADLTLDQKRQAINYLNQAVLLSRGATDRALEAAILSGIGYIYSSIDEHENALKYFRQSLPLWHGLNDKNGEAYAVNFIGSTYLRLGDYVLARQHLEQARALFREVNDSRAEGYTLVALAIIDSNEGNQQNAVDRYQNALKLFQLTGETHGEALVLTCLGSISWARGERDASIANYERALRLYRSEPDRLGEAIVLSNLGFIRQNLGQALQAVDLQNKAIELFRQLGDRSGQANCLYGLARSKAVAGQLDAALADITAAIEMIESIRGAIETDELKTSYLATQHDVYTFYVELLMQVDKARPGRGYDMQAFSAVEQAKARSLGDVLREARTDLGTGLSPGLRERERTLRQQISSLSRTRSSIADRQRIAELDKQLDTLTAEYQKLGGEIKAANPQYDSLMRPQPPTVQQVQALLDTDSVLLEYWLGERTSYLWIISREKAKVVSLPARARIETVARTFYEAVKVSDSPAPSAKAGEELSNLLLSPAANELGSGHILVVPDGILSYIPYAALKVRGDPLIRQHRVSYLPSASMLREFATKTKPGPQPQNSLAVFADPVFNAQDPRVTRRSSAAVGAKPAIDPALRPPTRGGPSHFLRLPGTRREANTILALAPESGQKKALDFDASVAGIKSSEISRYRFIHIATHGILDSSSPEFSGVVLSLVDRDGQPQDGFLRLNDIYNLRLSADLVVLSACQTALGKDVKGEGLVGLTRGFMYAGSRRVVASLWPVDDIATAELMKVFYSGLFGEKQLSPSTALREAQLSLMNDRRFSSPYYWAAFTLQGDPK
jgi:CHAT domain-containing protein/Tfp pilus assembly protein PilF